MTTHFGRRITAQIRKCEGKSIPVYALPTYADCHGTAVCVGNASTWTAAQELIHNAGYRIMRVGGLAEVTGQDGLENILVTVHPKP